jgi:hypothetical protein
MDQLLGAEASTPPPQDWSTATDAIDAIRDRFGTTAIGPASTLRRGRLRLTQRGAQQWGPDQTPDA